MMFDLWGYKEEKRAVITFDDEDGGGLDDDERGFFENAQFGPPIVLDHHSSLSYVEQMNRHWHE